MKSEFINKHFYLSKKMVKLTGLNAQVIVEKFICKNIHRLLLLTE